MRYPTVQQRANSTGKTSSNDTDTGPATPLRPSVNDRGCRVDDTPAGKFRVECHPSDRLGRYTGGDGHLGAEARWRGNMRRIAVALALTAITALVPGYA